MSKKPMVISCGAETLQAEIATLRANIECLTNNKWSEIELALADKKAHEMWMSLHGVKSLDDLLSERNAARERVERLEKAADSACFHYWNCDGECRQWRWSMAVLARACGFSDAASDDDIAQTLAAGEPEGAAREALASSETEKRT